MNIQKTTKIFLSLIILLSFFFLSSTQLLASEPSFSLFPNGGTVMNRDNGFVVDVLINTGGQSISSAKFTLLFDPEVLQLKKAERNNSLFKQYPSDESTIDNENGVVMLSGFTQSGSGTLYSSSEKLDVFARLTFVVLQEGETVLDWEYGGGNTPFDTVMYKDGSPPQNILLSRPVSATFQIGKAILDPSKVNTAISSNKYVLATGSVLVLFGIFMVIARPKGFGPKKGTLVVYDD